MRIVAALALAVASVWVLVPRLSAQDGAEQGADQPRATFRSGIELVRLAAVVRDRKGHPVTGLTPQDFVLLDGGQRRPIVDFRPGEGAITLAILLDVSGSMRVANKELDAREAIRQMLAWFQPRVDQAALFTFDSELRQLTPFTSDTDVVEAALSREPPFGRTALHDAIAGTAQRLAAYGGVQRAVVVVTDGLDNGSSLTPAQVSGIASSIDVPVYVVAVVSPLDNPQADTSVPSVETSTLSGPLLELAQWTGGDVFVSSAPAHTSRAARQLLNELRHQYLIAFEPGGAPGWHPLEVRTRDRDYHVLARSGYIAGASRPVS